MQTRTECMLTRSYPHSSPGISDHQVTVTRVHGETLYRARELRLNAVHTTLMFYK